MRMTGLTQPSSGLSAESSIFSSAKGPSAQGGCCPLCTIIKDARRQTAKELPGSLDDAPSAQPVWGVVLDGMWSAPVLRELLKWHPQMGDALHSSRVPAVCSGSEFAGRATTWRVVYPR
jgi:hypothetical protein